MPKGVLRTLGGNFPFPQAPTRVGAGHPSGERHSSSGLILLKIIFTRAYFSVYTIMLYYLETETNI